MKSPLESYFTSLQGKRLIVLGLGVSNRPLVKLMLRYGCTVIGCDRTPREKLDEEVLELEAQGCELRLGDGYLDNLTGDLVFRTPGMHPDKPELKALRDAGAEVTSEMEVFFTLCPCTTIAVTGSDGKTTTTTLISEMLKAAGKTVWLGGNIGTPLLPLLDEMKPEDYAVVELSSFQLMDMQHSSHVAVVTNLAPNHLDVHKDMDEYIQAKKNIFAFQGKNDKLILNLDNAITAGFTGNGTTRWFSRVGKTDNGICMDGNTIVRDGVKVLDADEIAIPGVHNIENYMAAILAVEGLVDDETIRNVARTFGGVEHRIELVRVKDGVKFYNDSIASSPSRTIAGLKSFTEKVCRAPLNQMETGALAELTEKLDPALILAYHSQGKEIYWKFKDYVVPGARELGEVMARVSGYTLADTPYESSFAGFKDWFIQQFRRPGYTVEVGTGENPLPLSQFPEIYRDNVPLLNIAALGI